MKLSALASSSPICSYQNLYPQAHVALVSVILYDRPNCQRDQSPTTAHAKLAPASSSNARASWHYSTSTRQTPLRCGLPSQSAIPDPPPAFLTHLRPRYLNSTTSDNTPANAGTFHRALARYIYFHTSYPTLLVLCRSTCLEGFKQRLAVCADPHRALRPGR